MQYSDYARWQHEWLSADGGAERERQLSYWRDRLAGAPLVLDLPTDRPRPAVQSHAGASLRFDIDEALFAERACATRAQKTAGGDVFDVYFLQETPIA